MSICFPAHVLMFGPKEYDSMIQMVFSVFVSCIGMIVSYPLIPSKLIGLKGKGEYLWNRTANDTKQMNTFCTILQYYKIRQILP